MEEIRRAAGKGCRAVTMPELPHLEGLPSYHDEDYWGPVFRTLSEDFGDKLPSDVFREHSLACYVTDKTSLKLRHEIGIDIIAWECDYPHSDCFWPDAPEQVLAELERGRRRRQRHQQDHLAELLPVLQLGPVRPHTARAGDSGCVRASAADVDVSIRPRKEWARLYAAKQLAKA